jgi:UDP-hydrolysing UDP-N-acetyl-D-glucosamine 2-epimerase
VKTVAAVTVSRADYGILRPVLRAIEADRRLDLRLIVAAAHLDPRAASAEAIARDRFTVSDRVEMAPASDDPCAVSQAVAAGVSGFAAAYSRIRPDIVLLAGDRFETLAAAVAAVPLTLPIAHIHGGELTEGAIDDQIRHAITKMSHLHFVAAEPYARRVAQMGESPWRIAVTGAPALDEVQQHRQLDPAALASRLGIALTPPVLMVTFHPETLASDGPDRQVAELTAALAGTDATCVITAPNVDAGRSRIISALQAFAVGSARAIFVDTLGTDAYFSLMRCAAAMVGNSSSGIVEAASFNLPVVNIGSRQAGRLRAANVIDVRDDRAAIADGIARALAPAFRASLDGLANPYGDGHAGPRIANGIAAAPARAVLLAKHFEDLPT